MNLFKSTFAVMAALAAIILASCSTPKNIAYLQDTTVGVTQTATQQSITPHWQAFPSKAHNPTSWHVRATG